MPEIRAQHANAQNNNKRQAAQRDKMAARGQEGQRQVVSVGRSCAHTYAHTHKPLNNATSVFGMRFTLLGRRLQSLVIVVAVLLLLLLLFTGFNTQTYTRPHTRTHTHSQAGRRRERTHVAQLQATFSRVVRRQQRLAKCQLYSQFSSKFIYPVRMPNIDGRLNRCILYRGSVICKLKEMCQGLSWI